MNELLYQRVNVNLLNSSFKIFVIKSNIQLYYRALASQRHRVCYLATLQNALCVKIMTSIIENWVQCNRFVATPVFDAMRERSREVEGNKIGLMSND
jgi:hypothetical protein